MTHALLNKALVQFASDQPEIAEDPLSPQFVTVGT